MLEEWRQYPDLQHGKLWEGTGRGRCTFVSIVWVTVVPDLTKMAAPGDMGDRWSCFRKETVAGRF